MLNLCRSLAKSDKEHNQPIHDLSQMLNVLSKSLKPRPKVGVAVVGRLGLQHGRKHEQKACS